MPLTNNAVDCTDRGGSGITCEMPVPVKRHPVDITLISFLGVGHLNRVFPCTGTGHIDTGIAGADNKRFRRVRIGGYNQRVTLGSCTLYRDTISSLSAECSQKRPCRIHPCQVSRLRRNISRPSTAAVRAGTGLGSAGRRIINGKLFAFQRNDTSILYDNTVIHAVCGRGAFLHTDASFTGIHPAPERKTHTPIRTGTFLFCGSNLSVTLRRDSGGTVRHYITLPNCIWILPRILCVAVSIAAADVRFSNSVIYARPIWIFVHGRAGISIM